MPKGDGSFTAAAGVADAGCGYHLVAARLDVDGDLDLLSPAQGNLSVLLNKGNASFGPELSFTVGRESPFAPFIPGDLDGDLDLDLAAPDFAFSSPGKVWILFNNTSPPVSQDRNHNAVPDDCELDCNQNGTPDDLDISTAASEDRNVNSIPDECEPPPPLAFRRGDCDGDGEVRGVVTDAVYLLTFNFLGGPAPAAPFPDCGPGDAEDEALGCTLTGEG